MLRTELDANSNAVNIAAARKAYIYAKDVIKGRWHDGESEIIKDTYFAYSYARDVIKGRWPEGETIIMKDAQWAYCYARDVIKGRWIEAESIIMKDAQWASNYFYRLVLPNIDNPYCGDLSLWTDHIRSLKVS